MRYTDSVMRITIALAVCLIGALPFPAAGASLTFVRDTISDSGPSANATHTIEFTPTNSIPAHGQVVLTLQASRFTVHPTFSFTDVDMAVAPASTFVDRTLAATESAAEDGVYVTTGTSGSVRLVLNSTSGIAAGERVRITLGPGASFGATGSSTITNHSTPGSYRIHIETKDASGTRIDEGTAMVAVVARVSMSSVPTAVPPTRSGGLPSGTIEANSSSVELFLQTNLPARCRYSTTPGTAYSAMTESFTASGFDMVFTKTVTGLSNGTTYAYYVRCDALQGAVNTDDYVISFTLKPTPASNTSGGEVVYLGSGGSGPYPGGSSVLFLSNVTLAGWTAPNSSVRVLRDGVLATTVQANQSGAFRAEVVRLERGVYTFRTSSIDPASRESGGVSTTLTLAAGTTNTVSDIILPPTVSAPAVALGDDLVVSGYSAPGARIELLVAPEKTPSAVVTYSASTSAQTGAWSIRVPAAALSRGVYVARARTHIGPDQRSDLSPLLNVGVGESARTGLRSDLNRDGKVNLVDFSILLTTWGEEGTGDINEDGTTNLADFSIMLFDWTG